MLAARILATASNLAGEPISTERVSKEAYPARAAEILRERSGIDTRYWDLSRSCVQAGAEVLAEALDKAKVQKENVSRVIFVNSTGGDQKIPANANCLIDAVGMGKSLDSFDLNNACMGFLSALDIAARSVATGMGPIAVVVVEHLRKHTAASYPRSYAVLADASVAVIVGPGCESEPLMQEENITEGFHSIVLGNDGAYHGSVTLAHQSYQSDKKETIQFGVSSDTMTQEALGAVVHSIERALSLCSKSIGDMDWVLTHQPNGVMFSRIAAALEIPEQKMVPVVQDIGSVGAASIPYSLDLLLNSRPVKPGDFLLMAGVGAGIAYGASIYQFGRVPQSLN